MKGTNPFQGSLARVHDGVKWMYVNRDGEIAWQ
ncbi:hypothetical protein J2S11_004336 [Bacillus horti]|uniref:WG repeat-containing protein n=1 Tax=Caldalkalibacillus horti TaxID=77523 RepID=A0ABT9W554_9BACI|nr:hypothetical protein [Bacillus horti]